MGWPGGDEERKRGGRGKWDGSEVVKRERDREVQIKQKVQRRVTVEWWVCWGGGGGDEGGREEWRWSGWVAGVGGGGGGG